MAHIIKAYLPTVRLPDDEVQLSSLYRSVLDGKRALLLLDNARSAAQVEPLIPPTTCLLLITSRQRFTLPGFFARDLDGLPPEDACSLLLSIALRIREQADEIARLCGYLPLALRLAASALAERVNLSPKVYARRLADAKRRLALIDASFSLSYELLNDDRQMLWRILAIFPGTFDAEAAATVWNTELDLAQEVLGELIAYSLVQWNGATSRYRLHDLAGVFANAHLDDRERAITRQRHAVRYLAVIREADRLYQLGGDAIRQGLNLFDLEWINIKEGHSWAEQHIGKDNVG